MIIAAVGLCMYLVVRVASDEPDSEVYHRTLPETTLDWRCDSGHTFRATGQAEPRTCSRCGQPAYPVATFECPRHGPLTVSARYEVGADGITRLSQVRIGSQDWTAAEGGLVCPRCNAPLRRKLRDLFEGMGKPKRPDGR
ncbi:MAG: hypothetical protein HY763_10545 [Planctomycetes bacterium]|nr:hypothetical protein [Planctomycetota bacterium]